MLKAKSTPCDIGRNAVSVLVRAFFAEIALYLVTFATALNSHLIRLRMYVDRTMCSLVKHFCVFVVENIRMFQKVLSMIVLLF